MMVQSKDNAYVATGHKNGIVNVIGLVRKTIIHTYNGSVSFSCLAQTTRWQFGACASLPPPDSTRAPMTRRSSATMC